MKSLFCIDCGRELNEYMSETLHYCNLCESSSKTTFVYEKLVIKTNEFNRKK